MSERPDVFPRRNGPWTVTGTRQVHLTPWLRVREDDILWPDGQPVQLGDPAGLGQGLDFQILCRLLDGPQLPLGPVDLGLQIGHPGFMLAEAELVVPAGLGIQLPDRLLPNGHLAGGQHAGWRGGPAVGLLGGHPKR